MVLRIKSMVELQVVLPTIQFFSVLICIENIMYIPEPENIIDLKSLVLLKE